MGYAYRRKATQTQDFVPAVVNRPSVKPHEHCKQIELTAQEEEGALAARAHAATHKPTEACNYLINQLNVVRIKNQSAQEAALRVVHEQRAIEREQNKIVQTAQEKSKETQGPLCKWQWPPKHLL